MADFLWTNEGEQYLGKHGLPTTVTFDLSTKSVDSTNPVTEGSTYATRGAATGTGYAVKTAARPAPVGGTFTFGTVTWTTAAATDWPANCRSIVATDGAGTALGFWNLIAGGGPRDMSAASTTENVAVTLIVS
jgi:hypothetical protein